MKNYKISIILPIYNVLPYIIECLNSICDQIITDGIECVLIDDCGQDDSIKLAENFILAYKGNINFKIIHHDHNRGLSAARNTGIREAKGEYVYFLDSDDRLYPDCIGKLYNLTVQYPHVDLVQGDFCIENASNSILNKNFPRYSCDERWIRTNLCNLRFPESACNRLVKRRLIVENELYFQEGWIQEDTIWNFTIHDYIKSVAFCFEPTYFYRTNQESIMHTMDKEKEANAYARIYNYVYKDCKSKRVESCELDFLEIIENRVVSAVGKNGYDLLNYKNDIRYKFYFKVKRSSKLGSTKIGRVIQKIGLYLIIKF